MERSFEKRGQHNDFDQYISIGILFLQWFNVWLSFFKSVYKSEIIISNWYRTLLNKSIGISRKCIEDSM